jgi:outer membrane protein
MLNCLRVSTLAIVLLCNTAIAEKPIDLLMLYQEATRQDPSLQRALAYNRVSQQREKEARGQLLPQLGLSNTFSRSRQEYEQGRSLYNGSSHALSLSQALYDPAAWRNYERFQELTSQQHLATDDIHQRTILHIAELYFTILAAEDELALTQAELDATRRNQQRIQALFQRQMAMLTDVLEADARVAALQINLLDAENAAHASRNEMAERIGRRVTERLVRLGENPNFSSMSRQEDDWVKKALRFNPALRSQEHSVNASEHAYRSAKAEHLPQIRMNLTAQHSDLGYEGNASPESNNLIAAVSVQLPLFSGGSTSSRSAALYAESDATRYDYERLKQEIIRETRNAQLNVETGSARILAAQQAQRAAVKSRHAAERAFELGVFNAVDVLERVRDEFKARRDLLRSQYSYITQHLLLYRWSGVIDESDILRTNDLLSRGQ